LTSTAQALFRSCDLGSGIHLHLHRTRSFKTIRARLAFQANLDETTAARALVPRVLARGTRRLPSLRDMQIHLDRLYGATLSGDARTVGERQIVQFHADWVSDKLAGEPLLDRMADLLAETLHEPAEDREGGGLREAVVEQERKMMADEAAAVFDDKSRYAHRRLLETMCRGEPFARSAIGRVEEIRALDPTAVRKAHRDLLLRAPADLFLVGDLTWRAATRFAKRMRLDGERAPAKVRRVVRRRAGRVRTVQERQEVKQAKLAMGFRTAVRLTSPLYPALALMNALFGGSPVGKLFRVVREQASLCYSIHSAVERTKGLLLVQAGIDEENYSKARRLILRQLRALREGRVSETELAMARSTLVSGVRALRDLPGAIIGFALERAINGLEADLAGLLAGLEAVGVRDVARAARTVELDTVYLLRSAD